MVDQDHEPSLYEYGLDADYAARLHQLHERLFKRIRWAVTVLQLASVTAVLGPYLKGDDHPVIASIGGVVLVAITVLDAATDFAGKVYQHRAMRRAYEQLSGRIPEMSLQQAKQALHCLDADNDATTFESLRVPAYNDNLRRHGRESFVRPLTRFQRMMAAIA